MIGHADMASTEPRAAAARLISEAIVDRQPVMALTSPPGSGKAEVITAVMRGLAGRQVSFMRIGNPLGTPLSLNWLLVQICGENSAGHNPDAALRVMQALRARSKGENQTVLLVEQAETLLPPSIRLLHLLTRVSDPTLKLVQVVFIGTEAFWELLQDQSFAMLRAQLATAVTLPAPAGLPPPVVPPVSIDQVLPVPLVATRARPSVAKAKTSRRHRLPILAIIGATMLGALVYSGTIDIGSAPQAPPRTGPPALGKPGTTQLSVVQPPAPSPVPTQQAPSNPLAGPPVINPPAATTVAPPATTVMPTPRSASPTGLPAAGPPPAATPPRVAAAPDANPQALPSISPATRRQLRQSFDAFLRQGRAEVAGLTATQRDQLFEQYLANYLIQEQARANTPPTILPDPPVFAAPLGASPATPPWNDAPTSNSHRVVIHYKSTSDAARIAAARMSSVLDATSARIELRPVDSVPRRPAVRYYSAEDREAARRLVNTLAAERLQPDVDWVVQDFSSFRPLPPPGTLEVWLPPS